MPTDSTNKRIAKNTFLLYIRMLVTMAVSLYTSRIILQALGTTDMGIYNIVGSVVVFMAFINNSMSISVQRFLTYSIGKNDRASINTTFNLSLLIHCFIAVIIFILAETLGYMFLESTLNIPENRMDAAIFAFHISIITCCIGIIKVPFNAAIIAYERMNIFAYLSIIESMIALLIAIGIKTYSADKLKLYAVLMMFSALITTLFYVVYCLRSFSKDIRLKPTWEKKTFNKLLSFASWSAFGEMAWAFTNQGVNLVINIFFGPVMNTARGISYQVQSVVMRFVSNFQTAVNPQIVKRYAAGEMQSLYNLVFRSTCFSYYMLMIISLPILLETEYILTLWLGNYPEYTSIFCKLILVNCMIDMLSNLLASLVKAYGKIKKYQIIISFILMLNLPLSYLAMRAGLPAYSTFLIYALISALMLIARVILLRRMIGFPVREFLYSVILKLGIVTCAILPVPIITKSILNQNNIGNFIIVSIVTVLYTMTAIYFLGLQKSERAIIHNTVRKILRQQ